MPSTGYTFPGTVTAASGFGLIEWTNPNNIISDDASYASALNVSGFVTTHYIRATNFGFAVPTAAQIAGIQVRFEAFYTVDSGTPIIRDFNIRLIIGGVDQSTLKTSGSWTQTTPTIQAVGGENDLWSHVLTPAIVNASDFGVAIRARNDDGSSQADLFIDYVQINVHYGLGRSQIRIID